MKFDGTVLYIREGIEELKTITDPVEAKTAYDALKARVEEVKKTIQPGAMSKSYAFYTPSEIDGLSEENKKIESLKNQNLDLLARAFALKDTKSSKKVIESCIKINRALTLVPFSKNGPDHPRILQELEEVIGRNAKTIDQLEFAQQQEKPQETMVLENNQEVANEEELQH